MGNWPNQWLDDYADKYLTGSSQDELRLISLAPIILDGFGGEVMAFLSMFTPPTHALSRIYRRTFFEHYGQCNIVKLLGLLEQIDIVVSLAADMKPASVAFHHWGYGLDEYAHAPEQSPPEFISLNLGNGRVRRILTGVMQRNSVAQCAIVDLMMHEKAHLALPGKKPKDEVHNQEFYGMKARLKTLFIKAVRERRKRDPFRRIRFKNTHLPTLSEITAAFSYKQFPLTGLNIVEDGGKV